ncbi:MAG: c-type cytochrome [Acidobacteriota bacterium]|nr:c-type cytochrome [Blastocatellia bacterium]MDW8413778.1 c-type cytochrome [Acidobacteriota bacterium]
MLKTVKTVILSCVLVAALLPARHNATVQQVSTDTKAVDVTAIDASSSETASKSLSQTSEDKPAQVYIKKCAGCHTIGKGRLTGPDLNESIAWAESDLARAVKAMEKHVGPISDEEVNMLVGFLKDKSVRERIKAEEERLAKVVASNLVPASPVIGESLYTGKMRLQNGGLACATCHSVTGETGMLGPDLSRVYQKLGEVPLRSSIEKANFRVMSAAYAEHPITQQEALHLTAYLKSITPQQQNTTSIFFYGSIGAFFCTLLLGFAVTNRAAGTRKKLRRRRNVLD